MRIAYSIPERGFIVIRGLHANTEIDWLLDQVRTLRATHPFEQPKMRDGTPLSVKVTSWGAYGWWSDERGFRYVPQHPRTREAWPPLTPELKQFAYGFLTMAAWESVQRVPGWTNDAWNILGPTTWVGEVDTALVNLYAADALLGWHVDKTEQDLRSPIVTMSLGASALFEIKLDDKAHKVVLHSGDGVVMAGASRNAEHRITRLLTPADVAVEQQGGLFSRPAPAEPIYNPLKNGSRLSITWRRTGLRRPTP
jgi:DNA oxidative demethylase